MAGKQGRQKIKRCPLCGGELHDGSATTPFFVDEKIVVIKDVPAEICSECGEPYMKSSVVNGIEALLDRLKALQSEISVVHYKAA